MDKKTVMGFVTSLEHRKKFEWDRNVVVDNEGFRLFLYTTDYRYCIVMRDGYMGCVASCRKPRAGEDWDRGGDLADGKCNQDTWDRIMTDIVCNELIVPIVPKKK